MTSKSRKRMHDLDSRICAIAAELENQAIEEWMAALSDEKLQRLATFRKGEYLPTPPFLRTCLPFSKPCPVVQRGLRIYV